MKKPRYVKPRGSERALTSPHYAYCGTRVEHTVRNGNMVQTTRVLCTYYPKGDVHEVRLRTLITVVLSEVNTKGTLGKFIKFKLLSVDIEKARIEAVCQGYAVQPQLDIIIDTWLEIKKRINATIIISPGGSPVGAARARTFELDPSIPGSGVVTSY